MRHSLTFAVLSTALLTFVTQFAMVAVALPQIIDDLQAPLRWGGWALTAFLVTQIVSMSFTGRLVERYGATAVFQVGVAVFGLASIACAVAPGFTTLLAARAVQGLGGGVIMPSGQSILGALYGEQDRARVIGLFASIMPFGAIAGPFLGGLIVEAAGWRWTFAVSVPVTMVVLLAGRSVLPPNQPSQPVPLDRIGALLLLVAVPSLILAFTELGLRDGQSNLAIVAGGLGCAAAAVVALLWYEVRVPSPILDLPLLRRREFLALNGLAFLFGLAWMGVFAVLPLYIQEAYEMSASATGTLMGPRALAMVVVSSSAALLIQRTGFRPPLVFGLVTIGGTLVVLSLGLEDPEWAGVGLSSFWWLMLVITAAGFFFGFANPALNSAGLDLAPEKIGTIAGTRGMSLMLGGTIGIALVVMAGSRAADIGPGMERMFLALALVLLAATLVVRWVPARPGEDHERDPGFTDGGAPQDARLRGRDA